ncbi:hypothetical protein NDU88_007918 [Pleurodeles waltl]|uniref:Uncharacterized protein n=1 Tax=Pleurodeles waltl TaxID=8319 RepID=A0AAV7RT94_PLEWA|nr:hypothetical protein NDU88_007918 [Pleurodeles waltl]
MPNSKTARKHICQLLFSEAISQPHPMASPAAPVAYSPTASANDAQLDAAMECILQKIVAVGRRPEAMDSKITDLSMASHSNQSDIGSFHDKVTNLDHRLTAVESQLAVMPERDSELQFLHAKLTDLEDRTRRDNVSFFGIPERMEGTDVRAYLKDILPELTTLSISQALEFQSAHRMGHIYKADLGKPRPFIAYFLRHKQACQVITAARAHGPYRTEESDIRMAADFATKRHEYKIWPLGTGSNVDHARWQI